MDHLDDNDVLAWVGGKLAPERLRELETHLDGCGDCRELAAQIAAPASEGADAAVDQKPAAKQLGRYSVLEPVGAGAMGIVYAAYDPVLDRRVALKLLHGSSGDPEKLRARLLREAQAMARLSHPNVIAVHDVGTVQDQVFVAMEFVEGGTLTQWLAKRRTWREVLRVFVLAGRGLAAAHAAGLVHRDFKPDNVLIGEDGRVRVTDFGLARADEKPAPLDWNLPGLQPDAPTFSTQASAPSVVSEQGARVGSPAYMAPEQLRGDPLDARADEFSFCVALYEALYGERPFLGADLQSLRAAIEAGQLRAEPSGTRIPGWVRRALAKGLAADPEARFPTLDALLDALEDDPSSARKQLAVGVLTLAALIGAFVWVRYQSGTAERGCQGAPAKLQGAWNPEVRAAAAQAFAQSKLTYAKDAWAIAEEALDRYAKDWSQARVEACEATAIRHEQSPELLDLRMSCLDDRLRELAATTALFAKADDAAVARAANLTGALGSLQRCADARALREPGAPAPVQRGAVDALRARIAQERVMGAAGKPVVALGQQLLADAQQLGYAPVIAEAQLQLATVAHEAGDNERAHKAFTAAAAAGLSAHVDRIVAEGWTGALMTDLVLSKQADAEFDEVQARAAVARLGDDPLAQAQLAVAMSGNARMHDRMDEAGAQSARAVQLLEESHADPQWLVSALGEASIAQQSLSHLPQALAAQEQAWKLAVTTYGPEHPLTGELEGAYGSLLCTLDRVAEGLPHLTHALQVMRDALGPNHPAVADLLVSLGDHSIRREPKKAQQYLRQALAILDTAPPTPSTPYARTLLGIALQTDGQLAAARRELERAIELEQTRSGKREDLEIALAQSKLGELLLQQGKLAAARAALEPAMAAQENGYGRDNGQTSDTLATLARVAAAEGKLPEARRLAERALAVAQASNPDAPELRAAQLLAARMQQNVGEMEASRAALEELVALPAAKAPDDEPFDRDEARFLLARALSTTVDKPRARALGAEALAGFRAAGPRGAKQAAEVKRWLAGLDKPKDKAKPPAPPGLEETEHTLRPP